eukprot:TRINITY_DN35239_c0_g1_i2.p1 TRINITY_DN35239_c0_g1~~TRINITY_DN35239_c0_g1_i2.p1  ORF type:complete len:1056 (-),score=229.38 TRINITY_DN35239_c0_g1_i2:74-3241(-)
MLQSMQSKLSSENQGTHGYLELREFGSKMGTKVDFATKFMRTTSIACAGEPQKLAVESLKDGDIQTFTDLINNKEIEDQVDNPHFWVNSGRKEEDGFNLAELAVQYDYKEALSTLVKLGVPMDLLNPITGYAPLHRAAEDGKPEMLSIMLGTTRHDFDVNARTAKRKRGLTALHLSAAHNSEDHLRCMDILLRNQFIEPDMKDSSWTTTPLYVAGKAKNKEAVVKLIENGADLDILVGNTNKSIKDFMKSWMPDLEFEKVRVKKYRSKTENLNVKLMEIVKDTSLDSRNYMTNFLKFRQVTLGLYDAQNGYEDLVEKTCRKGLADFAQILFKKGADPNKFPPNSYSCPIIDAAERGDFALMQVLKKNDADFSVLKFQTNETVFHCVLKSVTTGDEERYLKCLDILLNDNDEEFQKEVKSIINKSDINGNTALHYSTEMWPTFITRSLLQNGANIGIKNSWGEIPISRIPPDVMESFLNEDCLKGNNKDIFHKELEITFKYDFLAPDPASLPESFKPHTPLEECKPLTPSSRFEESSGPALPETESLWYMGQSKEHRHLLKHPVITSFLWFKWERIRPYFNRNLRMYLLFVFLLTWFIFVNFGGTSQNASIQETFHWLYIGIFITLVFMMVRDWWKDVQDALRAQSLASTAKNSINPKLNIDSPKMILQIIASNWVDIAMIIGMSFIFILNQRDLYIPIVVLVSILIVREIMQMAVSLKRYFSSFENWMELSMISLVIAIIANNGEDAYLLNRHLSAIALVLSWALLITLIGRHPKRRNCNVYVTMFYRVLNSFISFLIWYSPFIIAFGLGFYIMFHDDYASNPHGLDENDKNALFNKTWLSLVKTSAMFVGELEFSDLPINSDTYLGMLGYAFFLSFVFLIVVILMNLLNGLAVNDTSDIKQKAEIYSYISRVETISYMESVLLGDPFDFLSNVPKYLSNLPSGSFLRQLYKNGICRKIFTKIGAKGFLIFYTYLPDKQVTLRPNVNNKCCVLAADEMGKDIIQAAKEILAQQRKVKSEENVEISALRKELNEIREKMEKMDDIARKIDMLLLRK